MTPRRMTSLQQTVNILESSGHRSISPRRRDRGVAARSRSPKTAPCSDGELELVSSARDDHARCLGPRCSTRRHGVVAHARARRSARVGHGGGAVAPVRVLRSARRPPSRSSRRQRQSRALVHEPVGAPLRRELLVLGARLHLRGRALDRVDLVPRFRMAGGAVPRMRSAPGLVVPRRDDVLRSHPRPARLIDETPEAAKDAFAPPRPRVTCVALAAPSDQN